jgi:LPS-assembly lipoprotein
MSLSRRRLVVALAAAAAAGGCGFGLRQPARVSFGSIALTGFARRSPLEAELRRQLAQQVRILESPAQADVVLQALDDLRDKSVVASSAVAEVREVQLRLRFNFRVSTAGGRELIPRAELMVSRDMSFSETAALAKAYEEADLFREMQSDVVAQVMRRLASLKV